jgi:acyl-CoA dehydrogenase
MDFSLSSEQQMIVESVRRFVETELYPYEDEVEELDDLRPELRQQIVARAKEQGFYAANMPEEFGGGGLDELSLMLFSREMGRASMALQWVVARPSNILKACVGEQVERYLKPTIAGERIDCLAMTEPGAGSDVRAMSTKAVRNGRDFVINGQKHFITNGTVADYIVLFAASGEEETKRGTKKLITCFLVDVGTPGLEVRRGPACVSHKGLHQAELFFTDCRISEDQILGEEHKGFDVANDWLGMTRIEVAAMCVGRAQRAFEMCVAWAAERKQFGQAIGKFQGVSFKLADMASQIAAAELLTFNAAWKATQGQMTDMDAAIAKLQATEMLAFVTDEAIQIYGGMGLMASMPLERFWRDARVERIWDGTSEIQRHIISRSLLRPHER